MRLILIVLLLTLAGCVGCEESPWEPPYKRGPQTFDPLWMRNYCNPWKLTLPDTGGSPAAVASMVQANARWRAETIEYWKYPEETVAHGFGDCEDLSCLAAALLFRDYYPGRVMIARGWWKGGHHIYIVLPDEPKELWINNGKLIHAGDDNIEEYYRVELLSTAPRRRN